MTQVPQKLISFRAYSEGKDLVGVVDVELPKIEALTDTIKGAGIAGEVDCPTLGHFASMELKLTWRTIEKPLVILSDGNRQLELRGAQQVYDPKTGKYSVLAIKLVVQGASKSTELGKLEVATTTGSVTLMELNYMKLTIANEDVLEIDKYNYIANINGVDLLADIRAALGL